MTKVFTQLRRNNSKLEKYKLTGQNNYMPNNTKKIIDLEQLRNMAAIGCTLADMAGILGCSTGYLTKQRDENPAAAMALEEGYATMRQSLRRAQYDLAVSGNAPMLIWLGKQCLDQSDMHKVENKTQISITVQKAMDELRNIPKDQLLAAQALLSAPVIDNEEGGAGEVQEAAPHPPV